MLKIKLFPKGKKHQRTFRIVVAENRSKFDGKTIDDLGFFTPQTKTLQIDHDKLADWQKKGAHTTLGVNRLLDPDKFPAKVPKIKAADTAKPEQPPAKTETEIKTEDKTEKPTENSEVISSDSQE